MRLRGTGTVLLLAAFIAGCASRPPAPAPVNPEQVTEQWLTHSNGLRALEGFTLSGRLSTGQAVSASLQWSQQGERFSVRASGPFGSGAVALSGTPELVRIRTGDGTLETDQPQRWMQQQLGWQLPLAGLRYWALGLPMPGTSARYWFTAEGYLASLEQAGWQITYLEHRNIEGLALPARMTLDNGEQQALLRIDQWRPGARTTP